MTWFVDPRSFMSKCSSCTSKDSCSSGPKQKLNYGNTPKKSDMSHALKSPPKQTGDATPLNHPCQCTTMFRVPRSACMKCIRSFIYAVDRDKALAVIEEYRTAGKKVAAERMERVLEEKRRKEL